MCPDIEHEDRRRLDEYKSKLKLSNNEVIVDPLELNSSSWTSEKEGIANWPSLYYHDIAKYLDHLAPAFLCKLESEYKLGKAYRYFSCDFVRDVGFYAIDEYLCVLKTKVIPSQAVNNKPYDVWVVLRRDINEKPGGEIISGYCTCVAGLQGSCNHIIGMLFRVEAAVANGATRPSKTSTSCQWNIPSGNKVQIIPTQAEQLFFAKTKYGKSSTTEKVKNAKLRLNAYKPSMHKQHLIELKDKVAIRERLFSKLSNISKSRLAENMTGIKGGKQKSNSIVTPTPPPIPLIIHKLAKYNQNEILKLIKLDQSQCDQIEAVTRSQSTNPIWFEQRKGRITASKFYQVCTRTDSCIADKSKNAKNLVDDIMGRKKKFESVGTKHGLAMEPHAARKVVEVFKEKHLKVSFSNSGLVVLCEYPHLGASPDLIINCSCHGKFVVEIKCPEKIKNQAPSIENLDYLEFDGNVVSLKERHKFFFQIQGQMGLTKVSQGIFFVYTHHGYYMEEIKFNPDLFMQMLVKFNYFWSKFVLTDILQCQRGSNIEDERFKTLMEKNKTVENVCVCGVCFKEVLEDPKCPNDYGISCDNCLQWFHMVCVNIKEDEFAKKQHTWVCKTCPAIDFNIL